MSDNPEEKLDRLRECVRRLSIDADILETSDFVVENGVDVTDQKIRETRDQIASLKIQIAALEDQRAAGRSCTEPAGGADHAAIADPTNDRQTNK